MAFLNKIKSIFKKSKKPAKKARPIQAGKPQIVKPPLKKGHFKDTYRILREPHISEKATSAVSENKYTFKVFPSANKIEIKKAIESLYGVRVKDINIINVHRKTKLFRGKEGFRSGYKKAIVTLEKGEKIEILPH